MARCSRVWGITPSSAATIRSTASTPAAPATMARTKRLVSWHIDYTEAQAVSQIELGEAQLDGNPPLLLFAQPIGVDPRQNPNEGGLAVVDVSGRAEDQPPHEATWASRGNNPARKRRDLSGLGTTWYARKSARSDRCCLA